MSGNSAASRVHACCSSCSLKEAIPPVDSCKVCLLPLWTEYALQIAKAFLKGLARSTTGKPAEARWLQQPRYCRIEALSIAVLARLTADTAPFSPAPLMRGRLALKRPAQAGQQAESKRR